MELRFLLDTDIFIYIRRTQPERVLKTFNQLSAGEAGMSVITYGELLFGMAKSRQRATGIEQLERITRAIPVLALPESAAKFYGVVRAELETKGKIIGNNDLWIAAHAMAEGLTLVTNNEKEFRRVRGLRVENWAV